MQSEHNTLPRCASQHLSCWPDKNLCTGVTVVEGQEAEIGIAAAKIETGHGQSLLLQEENGNEKLASMCCHLVVSFLELVLFLAWQQQRQQHLLQAVSARLLQVHILVELLHLEYKATNTLSACT